MRAKIPEVVEVVAVDDDAVKPLQPLDVAEEVLQSHGRRHCLAALERQGAAVTPRQASTSKYFYFLHRRWFLIGQHSLPGVPGDNTKLQSWNMQRMSPVTSPDSPVSRLTSHLKQFRWKSLPSARSFFTFVSPFLGTIIFPQPPHVEQNFLIFQSR